MVVHRFVLPDLGEGIAEAELVAWLVGTGQEVEADEAIAEVSTDKVDVVIPSPVAGVVAALRVTPGSVVPVGSILAEIATAEGDDPAADARDATPAAAALAQRLGVDLETLPASERPLAASDVRAAARELRASSGGERTTIARRLTEAAAVPVVTNVEEVDFEAVTTAGERPLVAVARAAVMGLGEHPALNAWGDTHGASRRHQSIHLGIATQTPGGLVVPVVRDADRLTIQDLGREISAVTTAAREGRARPAALGGSTFTITCAGRLSGVFATPLLNLPEVAILGLYRVEHRPVVREGAVVARRTAHVSVTFDHRAIDGIVAAEFLARVRELLEGWPAEPEAPGRAA